MIARLGTNHKTIQVHHTAHQSVRAFKVQNSVKLDVHSSEWDDKLIAV